MRISDWSSDVCSSDLAELVEQLEGAEFPVVAEPHRAIDRGDVVGDLRHQRGGIGERLRHDGPGEGAALVGVGDERRSEEHTSELQSLMRISYAVFCLKKKKKTINEATYRRSKQTAVSTR